MIKNQILDIICNLTKMKSDTEVSYQNPICTDPSLEQQLQLFNDNAKININTTSYQDLIIAKNMLINNNPNVLLCIDDSDYLNIIETHFYDRLNNIEPVYGYITKFSKRYHNLLNNKDAMKIDAILKYIDTTMPQNAMYTTKLNELTIGDVINCTKDILFSDKSFNLIKTNDFPIKTNRKNCIVTHTPVQKITNFTKTDITYFNTGSFFKKQTLKFDLLELIANKFHKPSGLYKDLTKNDMSNLTKNVIQIINKNQSDFIFIYEDVKIPNLEVTLSLCLSNNFNYTPIQVQDIILHTFIKKA